MVVAQQELDNHHVLISHHAPRTPELQRERYVAHARFVEMAEDLLAPRVPKPVSRKVAAQMRGVLVDATEHQVMLQQDEPDRREFAVDLMRAAVHAIIESAAAGSLRVPGIPRRRGAARGGAGRP